MTSPQCPGHGLLELRLEGKSGEQDHVECMAWEDPKLHVLRIECGEGEGCRRLDLDQEQQSATVQVVGWLELEGRSAQAQGDICIFRDSYEHGGDANLCARMLCISPEVGIGQEVEWGMLRVFGTRVTVLIIFTFIEHIVAILALYILVQKRKKSYMSTKREMLQERAQQTIVTCLRKSCTSTTKEIWRKRA